MFFLHFNESVVLTQVFQRQETLSINSHYLSVSAEILIHMTFGLSKSLLIITVDEWKKPVPKFKSKFSPRTAELL